MRHCLNVTSLLFFSLLTTCARAERFDFYHEHVLGTSFHLQLEADSQATAEAAEAHVLSEIDRLAAIFSGYDPTSELRRFQSLPIGSDAKLSNELFEVLSDCEHWKLASHGAFNPAVEILSQEWKNAASKNTLPDRSTLEAYAERIGGKHWELHAKDGHATRTSNLPFSLNAIAKGYILDQISELTLKQFSEVQGVVVTIGGDIRVAGKIAASVAIADPKHDVVGASAATHRMIANAGIATSGNSERGVTIQGARYSHLIDPRTGMPVTNVVSATVVAPTASDADALATTCSVMTIPESLKLIDSIPGAECMLVSSEGLVYYSTHWDSHPSQTTLSMESRLVHFQSQEVEPVMFIEFEISKAENSGRYRRPYVAVWIEDEDGFPVKTLLLFLMQNQPGPRWHRDLRRWYADDQMRLLVDKTNLIDTVSKPTRNPGQYKVDWDGKDDAGMELKKGQYTLLIEAAREHGTYQLMKHKFELGGKAFEETLKGNAEISSASVKYKADRN